MTNRNVNNRRRNRGRIMNARSSSGMSRGQFIKRTGMGLAGVAGAAMLGSTASATTSSPGEYLGRKKLNIGVAQWWPNAHFTAAILKIVFEDMGYLPEFHYDNIDVCFEKVAKGTTDFHVAGWLPHTHDEKWPLYHNKCELLNTNVSPAWLGFTVQRHHISDLLPLAWSNLLDDNVAPRFELTWDLGDLDANNNFVASGQTITAPTIWVYNDRTSGMYQKTMAWLNDNDPIMEYPSHRYIRLQGTPAGASLVEDLWNGQSDFNDYGKGEKFLRVPAPWGHIRIVNAYSNLPILMHNWEPLDVMAVNYDANGIELPNAPLYKIIDDEGVLANDHGIWNVANEKFGYKFRELSGVMVGSKFPFNTSLGAQQVALYDLDQSGINVYVDVNDSTDPDAAALLNYVRTWLTNQGY